MAIHTSIDDTMIVREFWGAHFLDIMACEAVFATASTHIDLCHFFFGMTALACEHRDMSLVLGIIKPKVAHRTIPRAARPHRAHTAQYQAHISHDRSHFNPPKSHNTQNTP